MSPESITPPPAEQQEENQSIVASSSPSTHEPQISAITPPPHVRFSFWRWSTTGVIRVLYRTWTRVAVRLFPEDSRGEQFALALHLPLPDKLNMSWVNNHL